MHMADALLSPTVGATLWVAAFAAGGYSIRKIHIKTEENKSFIPLIGVAASFVFAAQMINFTIPGTGSSGHIGGGLLLSIMIGPYAAFLAMTVILLIQSLFFADGGILALGANIINMGFFSCFLAYPFIYKPLTAGHRSQAAVFGASITAAIFGLQTGAFGVVIETLLSGKTELPFTTFVLLMQPIHLAIGLVEGLITASLVLYVYKNSPELLDHDLQKKSAKVRKIIPVLAILALLFGGLFSWFASDYPDGLEWSIEKTAGTTELVVPPGGIHGVLKSFQQTMAFLPNYGFKHTGEIESSVHTGTTVSGLTGIILTLMGISSVIILISFIKRRMKRRSK